MGAFQNVAWEKSNRFGKQTDSTMTREEYHQLADQRYDKLQNLNKIDNFYDYEKEFEQIWNDLGRAVLESNRSKLPTDRRKKTLSKFGHLTINKSHPFSERMNDFQISPRLQELMVYAGQMECYERGNEVLQQFLDIQVSAAQVYRVTDTYGKEAEKEVNESRSLEPIKKNEILYVQADGSMLHQR